MKRLTGQASYRRLFREGQTAKGGWMAVKSIPNQENFSRFGVAIRRGAAASAVVRNKIKRWVREAFRKNEKDFPKGLDIVAVILRLPVDCSYHIVNKEVIELCKQL